MRISAYIILSFFFVSCIETNPNVNESGEDELVSLEVDHRLPDDEVEFSDSVYVPIYSDIYVDSDNPKCLLTATLSIRNTSFKDSLFVSTIDYYDSDGEKLNQFLDKTIALEPMASVNYVVEREDDRGGSGANFIVVMQAKTNISTPVVEAIMIGEYSNKSFSFTTSGYSSY